MSRLGALSRVFIDFSIARDLAVSSVEYRYRQISKFNGEGFSEVDLRVRSIGTIAFSCCIPIRYILTNRHIMSQFLDNIPSTTANRVVEIKLDIIKSSSFLYSGSTKLLWNPRDFTKRLVGKNAG